MTIEEQRLQEAREEQAPWRLWGPYLSERQWGTVREDYSAGGEAWSYFPHDHARSRAYRWGEDGLAGVCDEKGRLCFALALWNGNDPILKERLFGLTNDEGNHGEDVKECYFYLDSTPTHGYMKMLYKYPHRAFPYADLVDENRRRKPHPESFEYELLDTGVFANNNYTDVLVEYAKSAPTDILIRLSLTNRGEAKQIHVLPTLWFRNDWSWENESVKPSLEKRNSADPGAWLVEAQHEALGTMALYCEPAKELLFVENETNFQRLFNTPNSTPFPKDGINDYIVHGRATVNPEQKGTKSSAHYDLLLNPGETRILKLRLTAERNLNDALGDTFDQVFVREIGNADQFYERIAAPGMSAELRSIQRQAFAGMLWTKQFYYYVVHDWLEGDSAFPPPPEVRKRGRNSRWLHLYNKDVLSMPDKWEYPWFASWDSCFHTIVWAMIDPDYAKQQLYLLAREWYMHPEGQVPAYEWAFEDVNPPVHPWAAWRIYKIEKKMYGRGDINFLAKIFNRCLLYFTWWVNRKDAEGNNLFQGGFLGLDNIGLFDRSRVPADARIFQADASSWMGLFCLVMIKMGLELAEADSKYDDLAAKFFQHFVYIADSLNHVRSLPVEYADLFDDQDGFYYDVIRLKSGSFVPLKVRSLQGLMPIFAVETVAQEAVEQAGRELEEQLKWFVKHHPQLVTQVSPTRPGSEEVGARSEAPVASLLEASAERRFLFSLVDKEKLRRLLHYMLDEEEFLSPHGLRSVSRFHRDHRVELHLEGTTYSLSYAPAESVTQTFGGNSNWRGPVWFPINFLLIESLQKYHHYFGNDFKVECPTGSGNLMTLWEVSQELSRRLVALFASRADGTRPCYGGTQVFQQDVHWKDYILFFEYFHGDNGAGLGAAHQTGWTGLVAKLIQQTTEYAHRPPES